MAVQTNDEIKGTEKEFLDLFNHLCYSRTACDTILCAAIIVIDWFYFFEIHTKITGFCKSHLPFINSIANGLRKVLKEV